MPQQMLIISPAKVNLTLDVTGKRPDGYHELATVMHEVNLCDRLFVQKDREGLTLESDSRSIPMDASNLACRAALHMLERYQISSGLKIFIEKNIPIGAGLAGGSGNAAAVIKAVNELFSLGLSQEELWQEGGIIGSDVPFCISGGTALCTGRGEIIEPMHEGPELLLLLVKPPYELSTAEVYLDFRPELVQERPRLESFLPAWRRCDMIDVVQNLCNVLESVSIRKKPEIMEIKEKTLAQGALKAIMSGSGPTVMAAFSSTETAERAATVFRTIYKECYVVKSIR